MATEGSQTNKIAKSAGTVGIAVFASRILGLIREQVFAAMFGAGFAYDAFVVAFRIPNLLRDLFAEGALSSAFVAVFTDYKNKKKPAETWRLANNVITAIMIIVGIIVIAGAVFSTEIVSLLTEKEFTSVPGKLELTSFMTTIMFPFLVLVSVSAVAMGILNTMGKFFIPSLASSFFNLGSIVSGVALALLFPRYGLEPIIGMAIGVMVGGCLQLAIQVPSLLKEGLRYRPFVDFSDPGLRRIMTLMIPAVIGLSATQINLFINTFFASSCPEGSLSWLQYAFRLFMFPLGLVGVSLSIATMPVVSQHASDDDMPKLREAYVSSTILCLLLSIPAACGLIFLAEPIIRVIFERGHFTPVDTANTARALIYYTIGLFSYAALKITVPVFYALNKPKLPVIGSFITIALNICIVFFTIDVLQYKAIPLSVSICVTANFLFLAVMLYRELGGFAVGRLCGCLLKISPFAVAMGAGTVWINNRCVEMLQDIPFANLIALFIAIACGIVFYGCCLSLTGIKEATQLRKKLTSKLLKR